MLLNGTVMGRFSKNALVIRRHFGSTMILCCLLTTVIMLHKLAHVSCYEEGEARHTTCRWGLQQQFLAHTGYF